MSKNRFILILFAALIFMFWLAILINLFMDGELGVTQGKLRTDVLILFSASLFLVFVFIFSHRISRGSLLKKGIPSRLQFGAVIGLLLFLPQTTMLYGKIADIVQSEFTLFAFHNIMDIAIGRLIFALFQRKRPLLLENKNARASRSDHLHRITGGKDCWPPIRQNTNQKSLSSSNL
jgi:hypothetical protein